MIAGADPSARFALVSAVAWMADSRTEAGADPGAKRARVVAVPGSERARVIAALDFAEVLSTSSIDDDFKRVATALGGEHIFVPGSDKENGARRGARRKKMLSTLRELWQKDWARSDHPRPAQLFRDEHGRAARHGGLGRLSACAVCDGGIGAIYRRGA